MLDSIYHMTLKSLFNAFLLKTAKILLKIQDVTNTERYQNI